MSSNAAKIVLVTAPSDEVAQNLANSVVERHLAACVNIVPHLKSIYYWEGKVHTDSEVLMIIKTVANKIAPLEEAILKSHPYTTAEFVVLDTSMVTEKYRYWLEEVTND
jgi:periplasmic divalent cation tolerance protein